MLYYLLNPPAIYVDLFHVQGKIKVGYYCHQQDLHRYVTRFNRVKFFIFRTALRSI